MSCHHSYDIDRVVSFDTREIIKIRSEHAGLVKRHGNHVSLFLFRADTCFWSVGLNFPTDASDRQDSFSLDHRSSDQIHILDHTDQNLTLLSYQLSTNTITIMSDNVATSDQGKSGCSKIILSIIAFFLPPLTVGLEEGCGVHLLLNIILTIIIWIPGILHALYVVWR